MKVYLNSEGAILQTVPSVIPRGSTVTDFEVEAPFSAAIMAVRFTLRTGTTEPMILPMVSSVSAPGLNLWSAKLDAAVTEFSGSVPYSIEVQDASGYIIRTVKGSLTISPGQTPTVPADPPKDAWTAIRDYLNQILSYSKEAAIESSQAQEWISNFETALGIIKDDEKYELVRSDLAAKLKELVESKKITADGTSYNLVENMTLGLLRAWVQMLFTEGLIVGGSVQSDELLQLTGGKHIRFTSDEEMKPIDEMLEAYQNGEIGNGSGVGGTGKDGKSAYEYAKEAGYTGTEEEFAEKLAEEIPDELPNPHPITIDGTPYDGSEAVNVYTGSGKSVLAYGAKGDGKTDDTAALQAALAAERVVFVPGGDYVLSGLLTIRENSCLELSQDTVLRFKQTSGNAITLLRLASIKGNHATIFVPYTFGGNVINCDTGDDEAALDYDRTLTGTDLDYAFAVANKAAVKPFTHWNPQWKMSRYVTDINICKAASAGYCHSSDGKTYGTAVYLHCDEADPVSYMWGVTMSGVRISGAFDYGIYAYNAGAHIHSWNHDMRIEAVIDACKIGVLLNNCYYARLSVSVQGRAAENGVKYAQHGVKLVNSRGVDMTSCRVWDWNSSNTLWTDGGQYQHLAMIGECRGLLLDAFEYYEVASIDIRDLIYTDKASNLEQMTILQEPFTRWFKPVDGVPFFSDGTIEKKLALQEDLDSYFDADLVKKFTDILPTLIDTDGTVFGGVGYKSGYVAANTGAFVESNYYYATGFIPCEQGTQIHCAGMKFDNGDSNCRIVLYDENFGYIMHVNRDNLINNRSDYAKYEETENGFICTVGTIVSTQAVKYARISIHKTDWGETPMVALNEKIGYTVEGYLADGINVNGKNVILTSSGGKQFRLAVSDTGTLSATAIE